jgi:hypothetical protein
MLIGSFLQTAYSFVNAFWVGQKLGTDAMVAVTVSFPVFFVLMAVAGSLTMATTVLVSQAYGAKDFKFKNDTSFPILVWAQGVENTLYIGFYGKTKPPKVQWHHEMLKVYEASKVYRINSNLPAGTEKTILEGMNGGVVKSWLTIENPDGTLRIKNLGKSYYNPMSHIVEKGKQGKP